MNPRYFLIVQSFREPLFAVCPESMVIPRERSAGDRVRSLPESALGVFGKSRRFDTASPAYSFKSLSSAVAVTSSHTWPFSVAMMITPARMLASMTASNDSSFEFCITVTNVPGAQPNAASAAVTQRAMPAIRGERCRWVSGSRRSAPAQISSSAPRSFGCIASNSASISCLGRRWSSGIWTRLMVKARSARSLRVTTSTIEVNITGRRISKMISSSSLYSSRFERPPPVERRQIASDSQSGQVERLS